MSELRHIMQGHCPGAGQNKGGVSTDRGNCPACRASAEVWGTLWPGGYLDKGCIRRTRQQARADISLFLGVPWRRLERQGFRSVKLFAQPVEAVRP